MIAADGLLRVLSVNMLTGGIDRQTGDTSRLRKILEAVARCHPAIVLCQEVAAPSVFELQRQLWHIANELGMIPLLGPEGGITGNYPAILVRVHAGMRIIDAGPPPHPPASAPSWCEALIRFPELDYPVRVYSIHLPPRSSVAQLMQVQNLAATVAQRGEYAIAGGDWNDYGRGEDLTADALATQPPHLRLARMRRRYDGRLTPNYDVHDALAAIGMVDVAVHLPAEHRDPHQLMPTGINGGGRVDRLYVTGDLAPAAWGYVQRDIGGSDHQAVMAVFDPSKVTATPHGQYL